uniref:Uncharacterized protein n=1 Tax=viral metagenome TaxID=1070528 RepID=A0A6M3XNB1_9ZZZZ
MKQQGKCPYCNSDYAQTNSRDFNSNTGLLVITYTCLDCAEPYKETYSTQYMQTTKLTSCMAHRAL